MNTAKCQISIFFQLRYDPTEEIRIYHAIRQNHPNLLSPMAVIQFRKPQIFSDRKRSIYGYLLMENAGMLKRCITCRFLAKYLILNDNFGEGNITFST